MINFFMILYIFVPTMIRVAERVMLLVLLLCTSEDIHIESVMVLALTINTRGDQKQLEKFGVIVNVKKNWQNISRRIINQTTTNNFGIILKMETNLVKYFKVNC